MDIDAKKFLQKKNIILSMAVFIAALFFLFRFRSIVSFIVIAILAGVLNYFIHVSGLHVHLGHVSFLAIIFSYSLGFPYGILMIIIGHILPEIFAGHVDMEMIVSAVVYALVCYIAALFDSANIVVLGIFLTIMQNLIAVILEKMSGTSIAELITEHGVEAVMMLVYFVSFAKPLITLLD